MQLLFLGTGAADYDAALSCSCHNCREARAIGGPNLRTYASLLINRRLLLDCGRTVPTRLADCHAEPGAISDVIVTHSHGDHLDVPALAALAGVTREGNKPLHVWGNARVCDTVSRHAAYDRIGTRMMLHEIVAGERFTAAGLEVLCLAARHGDADERALNYVIAEGDAALLYATDTAWPPSSAWEALAGVKLNCAVVEATFGPLTPGQHPDLMTHHLNWDEAIRLCQELEQTGRLKPGAVCYGTHMSQHHVPIHDRCHEELAARGLTLAYDGCEAQI